MGRKSALFGSPRGFSWLWLLPTAVFLLGLRDASNLLSSSSINSHPAAATVSITAADNVATHYPAAPPQSAQRWAAAPPPPKPERWKSPLPRCATRGRARAFLMVFSGHSGSSAVFSELRRHSQLHITNPELVDHGPAQHNTTLALQRAERFFAAGVAYAKTAGFKLRADVHVRNDPAAWAALARKYDVRVVWNYRQNLFKQAVGEYKLKKFNDTSVIEGLRRNLTRAERCRLRAGCSFRVDDLRLLHERLREGVRQDRFIAEAVRAVDASRGCVFALPYEDYLYERAATMRRLQRFLGVRHEDHPPLRFKSTADSMCRTVRNWDQLCRYFYGCRAWRGDMDDAHNKCGCAPSFVSHRYCATQ